MIYFQHPEIFLLGVVVVLWLRRRFAPQKLVGFLRLVLLFLLLALLARPYRSGVETGRDLILLVDRSYSVPEGIETRVEEIAQLAERHRGPGDTIGMVSFGRNAAVEAVQSEEFSYRAPVRRVDPDATDLMQAIDTGLAMILPGRQGSLLIVSDGENTGADPAPSARDALRRGIRIDAVALRREGVFDLAVEDVAVPADVGSGEPFQFSTWVRSDRAQTAPYRLLRDGALIAEGEGRFRAGLNRLVFRDRLAEPGVHEYSVEILAQGDRITENNRARAVVRVSGPFRVLVLTPQGREDRLTRSLTAAGLRLVVADPRTAPLDLNSLDSFRAVVLENVPAEDLPNQGLQNLQRYVADLGGGVLMTGGRASFGPGGYHRSALEEVLPVSMEVRQEQRKFALAMAIALDRSGSMQVAVPSGEIKMDLANLGASAAVELLGRADSVAVIAVDSSAHVVVPLSDATDREGITARIRTIESMGGGIYTSTAIHAAARELVKAAQTNKHIVIFADANDAEEPGDYKTFVPDLVRAGVTVSVIGLGSDTDSDADFLRDVARLGKGRAMFVNEAADLPRAFAQETIQVARSSLVEEPTTVGVLPDITAVGDLTQTAFPTLAGYCIAYLKSGAQMGLLTRDEQRAPMLSFWHHGLGRAAAYLGEVDGDLSGELQTWSGYTDFFATLVRWLSGTDAAEQVFAELRREGHQAVLSVEVDRGQEGLLGTITTRVLGSGNQPIEVLLQQVGERRLEARFPLEGQGIYRAALDVGAGNILRVPPVTLPYSPEFQPRIHAREGEEILARITEITGGRLDPPATDYFAGSRESTGITDLTSLCAWIAVFTLLLEILIRRWNLSLPTKQVAKLAGAIKLPKRQPRPRPDKELTTKPEPPAPTAEPEDIVSLLERTKSRRR